MNRACILLSLAVLACAPGWAHAERPFTVGMVFDEGPGQVPGGVLVDADRVVRELTVLLDGERAVRAPADKRVHGNFDPAALRAGTDALLADPQVDVVLALGLLASQVALRTPRPARPLMAPYVVDPVLQDLPYADGASGVRNLHYLASIRNLDRALGTFQRVVPLRRVALLVQDAFVRGVPDLGGNARRIAAEQGLELVVVPVGGEVGPTLAALPADTDGVVLTPLPRLAPAQFSALVEGLRERRVASFSVEGVADVRRGVLAGTVPPEDRERLARRIALDLESIARGRDPGTLAVAFGQGERLTINMDTGRAIGYSPPWAIMSEADFIALDPAPAEAPWTLGGAVRHALTVNLGLVAADQATAAGARLVDERRGALGPALDVSMQARRVDADRAAGSFGALARDEVAVGLQARQALWNEGARAAFEVERFLHKARQLDRETARQDVAAQVALAYLDLLLARSNERIRAQNLRTTRANLDRARARREVGYSGPGEEYRWQSEVATTRAALLRDQAASYQAEIVLNRLLHRPLEQRFNAGEADLDDESLIVGDARFFRSVASPAAFSVFRDFIVSEALDAAPELARLDAAIAGQQRAADAARRALYVPDVGLRAGVTERVHDNLTRPRVPALPGLDFGATPDNTDWDVGLTVSLPLARGGALRAARARAAAELGRLRTERAAAAEQVEARVRALAQAAAASFASIGLAREAAAASERNLDLVTDAYARGVVTVVELLDAQNAALASDQNAASAVYRFLSDLVRVHRAAGEVDLFIDPGVHEGWYERLEQWFAAHGAS